MKGRTPLWWAMERAKARRDRLLAKCSTCPSASASSSRSSNTCSAIWRSCTSHCRATSQPPPGFFLCHARHATPLRIEDKEPKSLFCLCPCLFLSVCPSVGQSAGLVICLCLPGGEVHNDNGTMHSIQSASVIASVIASPSPSFLAARPAAAGARSTSQRAHRAP